MGLTVKNDKIKFGVLFAIVGCMVAVVIAHYGPIVIDKLRDPSRWLQVIDLSVDELNIETGEMVYSWHRWCRTGMVVDTYLDLIKDNHEDKQLWSADYQNVYYEKGEYCFTFTESGIPTLSPGEYKILGLSVFTTCNGVVKQVEFEFPAFTIE